MKSFALWIVGAVVLVAVIGLALFLYVTRVEEPIDAPVTDLFPIATSTTGIAPSDTAISIPLQNGSSVLTQNFIANGITAEDPANEGSYYLAGKISYCDEEGNCPGTIVSSDYNIVYFSDDGSFSISLRREPLGEVRRNAESYLMRTLGLSQVQMCALNYHIGTTVYVSETYGSMGNLGFSFCPGAVPLP